MRLNTNPPLVLSEQMRFATRLISAQTDGVVLEPNETKSRCNRPRHYTLENVIGRKAEIKPMVFFNLSVEADSSAS